MDKILPIDFAETETALATNLETRREAHKHLKNDGAVIISGWRDFWRQI